MNGRILLLLINILFHVREKKAMKSQELFVLVFVVVPFLPLMRKVLLFLPSLTFKPKPLLLTGSVAQ